MSTREKSNRLFSLDALRGLDMLFLCVGQPLIVAVAQACGVADPEVHPFMRQFHHYWGGFTAYDLIMPLFIFMSGAAIPLALSKRLDADGRPTASFWKHVVVRFVLLWILGMVSQGRLLGYDPLRFVYYSNTLQAIAVGYAISALVMLIRNRAMRLAMPFALAVLYGLLLQFGGDYSVQGNLAMKVDRAFVRVLQPCGHDTGTYTWYLTSLMFGAMALCGMEATFVLKSEWKPWRKAGILGLLGVALWGGGLALEALGVPCIKHIFTVSFTAQAMGVSVLLLVALYVINDICNFRRGWGLVTLYGQTALASYVLGEVFRAVPTAASKSVFGGLILRIGVPWDGVVLEFGVAAALTFAIVCWRKSRGHF